jgi:1-acyl-sn-glycerol-3-phosphate acyltransferase
LGDDPFAENVPPPAPLQSPVVESASDYGPSIDRAQPRWLEEIRKLEHPGESVAGKPIGWVRHSLSRLMMRDRSDAVDEFGRDPHMADRYEPMLDFLYRSYFRVDARGLGHVPESGRGLIVGNHSGTLPYDAAMVMCAVKREHSAHRDVRPLVEDFVFHFPYLGTFVNRIGAVRACPENAMRLLEQDQLVAAFPEGVKGVGKRFAERYQLQRFGRGGFIKLALRADAPIIPTAIVGAEETHPLLGRVTWLAKSVGVPYFPITPTFPWLGALGLVPLPTKWTIVFGEPLYYNKEYGPEGAEDRILVNRMAEQVRLKIQVMVDELVGKRKSVLFG